MVDDLRGWVRVMCGEGSLSSRMGRGRVSWRGARSGRTSFISFLGGSLSQEADSGGRERVVGFGKCRG